MLLRHWLRFAVLSIVLCFVTGAQAQTVMRISHQLPPAHHIAKLLEQWAADAKARSGGKLDIQILGADQAFKPDQNYPAVARGQVEAAMSVNFQWGNTIPEMNVVTIPYLFTDLEKVKKFPTSEVAKALDAKLAAKGVKNLAWFFTTRVSIFTSSAKPIVTLADFKGLKIRGLNKLVDNALVAAGASPSAIPGSEVMQALQTRVLDAGLTDVSAAYSRKYYEIQKYGTISPFFTVYFHLYCNPDWFNKLSPELQKAIEGASQKAEMDSIPLTEATAADATKQLGVKGMVLHMQTAAEAKDWEKVMQPPVLDAFKKAAPDGAKLIDLASKM